MLNVKMKKAEDDNQVDNQVCGLHCVFAPRGSVWVSMAAAFINNRGGAVIVVHI